MISTPQTGIDSILVAASFLGWPLAIFKVALAAVTGIVGGPWAMISLGKVMPPRSPLQSNQLHHLAGKMPIYTHKILSTQSGDGWSLAFYSQQPLPPFSSRRLVPKLLIHFCFHRYYTLLIALPLYVCATASVPIAAALVSAGMPLGSALIFLMAGPATNAATIGTINRTFGLKRTIIYLITIIVGSVGGAFLFEMIWGKQQQFK